MSPKTTMALAPEKVTYRGDYYIGPKEAQFL